MLLNHSAHVWMELVEEHQSELEHYLSLLSPEERKRADSYRFEVDYTRFVIRRGIMRKILSRYLKQNPKSIKIEIDRFGKPYVKDFNFNISFSHGLIYLAIGFKQAIGVDVEYIEQSFVDDYIADLTLHRIELQKYMLLPKEEKILFFYQHWSLKEAIVKALGKGLFYPLSSLQLDFSNTNSPSLSLPEPLRNWSLIPLNSSQNYVAYLASNQLHLQVHYFRM